jgi:signal transduction histidine kinase
MIHNTEALQMMIDSQHAMPADVREVLSDIQADGHLASEIIDRHRTMLRSRQMQVKTLHLQTIVDDTLALVTHDMIARQVEVTTRLAPDSCAINGDPVLLEQVFVNLVMNAMDAIDTTGSMTPLQRHITISSEVAGSDLRISIHDTGPGLPADLIDRLFTPFVTTKPHGLGIGLAIARSIVEAHGGRIDARNHPEGGAVFTVSLPIYRERAAEPQAA